MKPAVVLDKNYLQGSRKQDILALSQTHQLVMSGALFYELITTSELQRRRCFGKLPATENPVELVDHVGELLRRELKTGEPCGKPSANSLGIRFRFNPGLVEDGYQLPESALEALRDEAVGLAAESERLLQLSETIPSLFTGLLAGNTEIRQQQRVNAEAAIADVSQIMTFYRGLASPDPRSPFPSADIVGPEWGHIRWVQIQMLFALDLHLRYQGCVRTELTDKVQERLEHDVHDAQHLALGVLEGAFATREKKLVRWWRLLRPDGVLFE
ncbi:MAG: hypothetical protein JWQ07_4042 [Ramlibacter sp.]|nr:hypothetical protein [Ramlibacter sp.]